jgi:PKD repeat protein
MISMTIKKISLILLLVLVGGVCGALPTANYTQNIFYGNGSATVIFNDTSDVYQVTNTSWIFSNVNPQPTQLIPLPTSFSWAPINIYKNDSTYSTDFNIDSYKYIGAGKIYYVNGSQPTDTGDGLSWATAFKYPSTAIGKSDSDIIYVSHGEYNTLFVTTTIPHNMSIIGVGNGVNFTKFYGNSITWSASPTPNTNSTYNTSVTVSLTDVFDTYFPDQWGYWSRYALKTNVSDVDITPGSYFRNTTENKLYVHRFDEGRPNATSTKVSSAAYINQVIGGYTYYAENINFQGGNGIYIAGTPGGVKSNFYSKDCTFSYSGTTGVKVSGGDGYFKNSSAFSNTDDGFNYNPLNGITAHIIEVDTSSHDNGLWNSGDAVNGASGHGLSKIVRINGRYYHNHGANIHDVIVGMESLNIQSLAYNSSATDSASNVDWRVGSSGAGQNVLMWFWNCSILSPLSIFSLKTDGGSTAYVSEPKMIVSSGLNITLSESESRYFDAPGIYIINHSVTNTTGTSWKNGTVEIFPLFVQFTPAGPVSLTYPSGQAFTDTSTGSPTAWNWSYLIMGAGSPIPFNETQNATFFPPSVGNFTIAVNASNTYTFNISAQTTWVNVSSNPAAPVALMSPWPSWSAWDPTVILTDTSTGIPTNCTISWGDSVVEYNCAPYVMHQYQMSGIYPLDLTVSNAAGNSTNRSWIQIME